MPPLMEYRTMPAALAAELRDRIISGALAGGAKIDQKALAEEFGVSRMPVREALRLLDAEGFVTIVPHKGAVVSDLGTSQIVEIYEIRAVLEGLASGLAVDQLTDADLAVLGDVLAALERTEDVHEWSALNAEFHVKLASACGRPRLLDEIQLLRRQCEPYVRMYVRHLHHDAEAGREHAEILAAARARDAALVEQLVRAHLMSTAKGIARAFEHELDGDGAFRAAVE